MCTYAFGSNHVVWLAGIAWSLVSGTNVIAAGRRWILDSVELGSGFELSVAMVFGRNFSGGRVAEDFSYLVHVGLGCLPQID